MSGLRFKVLQLYRIVFHGARALSPNSVKSALPSESEFPFLPDGSKLAFIGVIGVQIPIAEVRISWSGFSEFRVAFGSPWCSKSEDRSPETLRENVRLFNDCARRTFEAGKIIRLRRIPDIPEKHRHQRKVVLGD